MSDTPRTDRNEFKTETTHGPADVVHSAIARMLERELSAVTAKRDALREALSRLVELKDMKDRAARENDGWVESTYYRSRGPAWDAARAVLRRP